MRIAGEPFAQLCYHFVLTCSNWEAVSLCTSESFEALSEGPQGTLWRLMRCRRSTARPSLGAHP